MTDTIAFLNFCVSTSQQFNHIYEDLKSISDRIGADTALSTATAAAAQGTGRKELTAADFDNLKVAIDLLTTLLNATNNQAITVVENTGGAVKLAYYRMI